MCEWVMSTSHVVFAATVCIIPAHVKAMSRLLLLSTMFLRMFMSMTPSHAQKWYIQQQQTQHDSLAWHMCDLAWLIHTCATWHDSFTHVPWLVRMRRIATQGGNKHTRWRVYMCDLTHLLVWHDSYTCVTWLVHACDMTLSLKEHSYICTHAYIYI